MTSAAIPELLTTRELAAVIKRSPETLMRWRRLRVGPPFRQLEGRVLYASADVRKWLDARSSDKAANE